MTVNRTAGVLTLTFLLGACTAGTTTLTGDTTPPPGSVTQTNASTSTTPDAVPTVTTVPGGPTLSVYVKTDAEILPAPPGGHVGKYRDSKSLCDAVLARPIKGFTPSHMGLVGTSETIAISCILTDDHNHHVIVGVWRGDQVSGPRLFDDSLKGNTPVSGVGDKAALSVEAGTVLEVLKDTDNYHVDAEVDGDVVAVEKEIALAVV
jgi:hypothetical protein